MYNDTSDSSAFNMLAVSDCLIWYCNLAITISIAVL